METRFTSLNDAVRFVPLDKFIREVKEISKGLTNPTIGIQCQPCGYNLYDYVVVKGFKDAKEE